MGLLLWRPNHIDGMAASTLIYFTAVLGLQKSSMAFHSAYNSTLSLARLIWVGRLLFLEYSLPVFSYDSLVISWPSRDFYPSQPERLEAIRQNYMLPGCHSPLGEIYELKAFGRALVKCEGPPGNLTWAQDGMSFTIGDNSIVQLSESPLPITLPLPR